MAGALNFLACRLPTVCCEIGLQASACVSYDVVMVRTQGPPGPCTWWCCQTDCLTAVMWARRRPACECVCVVSVGASGLLAADATSSVTSHPWRSLASVSASVCVLACIVDKLSQTEPGWFAAVGRAATGTTFPRSTLTHAAQRRSAYQLVQVLSAHDHGANRVRTL